MAVTCGWRWRGGVGESGACSAHSTGREACRVLSLHPPPKPRLGHPAPRPLTCWVSASLAAATVSAPASCVQASSSQQPAARAAARQLRRAAALPAVEPPTRPAAARGIAAAAPPAAAAASMAPAVAAPGAPASRTEAASCAAAGPAAAVPAAADGPPAAAAAASASSQAPVSPVWLASSSPSASCTWRLRWGSSCRHASRLSSVGSALLQAATGAGAVPGGCMSAPASWAAATPAPAA
jgi:hypothetical protein